MNSLERAEMEMALGRLKEAAEAMRERWPMLSMRTDGLARELGVNLLKLAQAER